MFARQVSVQIDAPPETVFDYVSDFSRHPEWNETPVAVTAGDGPVGVGSTFETHGEGKYAKVGAQGTVTAYQRPSLITYRIDSVTGRTYVWTFTVQPKNGGSELTHRFEQTKAQAYFKLLNPIVFKFALKTAMNEGLANIKARVEGSRTTAAV
jgi:uncharacterized protein YndB with AHSA1/START domain